MTSDQQLARNRFCQSLETVAREAHHLAYSHQRLYAEPIDTAWVLNLDNSPELGERLEAFVSRFGRMQDTIASKLLPRWLICLEETPGSQIEILNRAERLGVIEDTQAWLEARRLRNRLVHEYMENAENFAQDLLLARDYSLFLFESNNRLRQYALTRMAFTEDELPVSVTPPHASA